LVGDVELACKKIFEEVSVANDFTVSVMEIMPDHVHVFISAHPKIAPGNIVKMLKGISGKVLFAQFPELKKKLWGGHLWNPSTYYGTVGDISREQVERYISMQKSKDE